MMDYGYEDDREPPPLALRCSDCGQTYADRNDCPACGSLNCSYAGEDAREWNEYADRGRR